ncbi:hypothetical protein F2Q69_00020915 [Brassica cretica]|uniref:Uncharacterized protein n=1 Tax=Brassica cretica TaxID=69181 RepID=A0A8S9Q6I4_BRACR|nr:hypothetical protein F2Q69_00020915 [Brassica cretica]
MFLSSKEFEANSDLSGNLYGSGPVLNAYMLDQAANEFYNSLQTPTVRLVTTVNTKRIGAQNQDVAVMVNASEVTKAETLTIRDIFAFLKQEPAQHRRVYKYEFVRKAYVVISDPIVARHVLGGNTFSDKGVLAEIFQPIMGKGFETPAPSPFPTGVPGRGV